MQATSVPGHVIVQSPFAEDVGYTVWAAHSSQVVYSCTNHQQALVVGVAGDLPSSEQLYCQRTRWRKNSTLHTSEAESGLSRSLTEYLQAEGQIQCRAHIEGHGGQRESGPTSRRGCN